MTHATRHPDRADGMVSEIRSANDVNEVLHFVTSGHKVYTTVHANSANGVLPRLIALGVRPEELAGPDAVNSVLRQKLVPQLCPHCAEPLTAPAGASEVPMTRDILTLVALINALMLLVLAEVLLVTRGPVSPATETRAEDAPDPNMREVRP